MKLFFSFFFLLLLSVNSIAQYSWQLKISGGGRGNPIAIDPINKNIIYYGSSGAVYRSTDKGESFSQFGTNIPSSSAIKSFHIHSKRQNEMVVAVYKNSSGYKMVKTTDNGTTWVTTHDNLSFSFYGVPSTQDPSHPDTIYIMNGNNFDRSTDFGETWTTLTSSVGTTSAPCDIEVFPDTSIIVVGDQGHGIFRSTDYGLTWSHVYSTSGEIPTIAVDFKNPSIAWATKFSGGGGVIRSTDYGQSWSTVAYSGISTWGVHIHPANSDYVVVGTWSGSNVYITRNWGTSWTHTTLPPSNYAVAIIDTMNVFAAQSGGFYKMDSPYFVPVELTSFTAKIVDNKTVLDWATASEINNRGFDVERKDPPLNSLPGWENSGWEKIGFVAGYGTSTESKSYSFIDKNITAGKYFYRLKQVDFDGTFEYSPVVEIDGLLPSGFYLAQNHPNPFNPSTSIRFSLPVESYVKIRLFNLLGEKVTEITNREFSAGVHTINFTADGLSSGTYLYILEAIGNDGKTFSDTKKLILLK